MSHTILTDDNFEAEVLKSDIPVLVDFWAEWCQPCKMVEPIVSELATEYEGRVKVAKMNVDENTQIPSSFGIMSIPTVMVFKGGKPVTGLIGVQPKQTYQQSLDKALA